MPGFSYIKDYVDSIDTGQSTLATFRKAPSQATTASRWFDLSMSPGNPVPQYYASAPLVGVQMKQSDQGGLFHGAAVSPKKKYVKSVGVNSNSATPLPMRMILCDYLLYYPFIDDGTTDLQPLDNTASLPRYTDGKGVQVMGVSVAARTGGQTFSFIYTNQDGVGGRQSQTHRQTTNSAIGTLVNQFSTISNDIQNPFLGLQTGDTGVRSIQSVTMNGTDVGLFSLVLVKPLLPVQLNDTAAYSEVVSLLDRSTLPQIQDDAYLNFICYPNGALNVANLNGLIETVWN